MLFEQGKHAEAVEIEREVLVHTTRLLSAESKITLTSASNLAILFFKCGQQTEVGKILRDTLALCQRALDAAHEQTPSMLRNLRALDLTAL